MELNLVNQEYISVKFEFNKELVNRIRELENRRWNPREKQWEIHIAHLPDIMEIFYLHPTQIDKTILNLYQKRWITTGLSLRIENTYIYLSGSAIPLDEIDDITSFPVPGSEYNRKVMEGSWDGKKHLFNKRDLTVPTGLLPRLLNLLDNSKIQYSLEDNRNAYKAQLKLKSIKLPLREYQKSVLEKALQQKRGIIEMATGAGKTMVAAAIISQLNLPTIFFVHTRELLYQTIEFFESSLRTKIGQVGDGIIQIRPITVATIQTVIRSLGSKYHKFDEEDEDDLTDISSQKEDIIKMVTSAPVVFFDECHHIPSDTCYTTAMKTHAASYRYGLSATPYRADRWDMLIEAALGQKIVKINASVLIDTHYLVPPKIFYIPVQNNGKFTNNKYNSIYQRYIVNNPERNSLITQRSRELVNMGLTVLILVNQVKHGRELHKLISESEFIQGADSTKKRQSVLKQFKEKKLNILIATTLADEGLDIPTLGAVILAGGGKSETRALQRVGRALRPAKNKSEAVIIDFIDKAPYLFEHSLNRLEIFKTEPRFKINIEGDLLFPKPDKSTAKNINK